MKEPVRIQPRGNLRSGAGAEADSAIGDQLSLSQETPTVLRILSSVPLLSFAAFAIISFAGAFVGFLDVLQSGQASLGFIGFGAAVLLAVAITAVKAFLSFQIFRPEQEFWSRALIVISYLVLATISLGFSFAFYWSQLEARTQALGDAQRFLSVFDREITIADTQLAGTLATLTTLNTNFNAMSEAERSSGNQCGEVSGGGEGPRTRHLATRAGEIDAMVMALTPQIQQMRSEADAVRVQIENVRALSARRASEIAPSEREAVFREASRTINQAGITLQALATSQSVRNYTADLRFWANEYANPALTRTEVGSGTRFKCYNTTISSQMNGVAADLESLPVLPTFDFDLYQGPQATREALDRFWSSIYSFAFIPSASSMEQNSENEVRRQAIAEALGTTIDELSAEEPSQSVQDLISAREGLREDDILPLALAAMIEALFLLSASWSLPARNNLRASADLRTLDQGLTNSRLSRRSNSGRNSGSQQSLPKTADVIGQIFASISLAARRAGAEVARLRVAIISVAAVLVGVHVLAYSAALVAFQTRDGLKVHGAPLFVLSEDGTEMIATMNDGSLVVSSLAAADAHKSAELMSRIEAPVTWMRFTDDNKQVLALSSEPQFSAAKVSRNQDLLWSSSGDVSGIIRYLVWQPGQRLWQTVGQWSPLSPANKLHEPEAKAPLLPPRFKPALGTMFRECSKCPQMVVVPKSGSSSSDVSLAFGRFEVTQDEYRWFETETARNSDDACRIRSGYSFAQEGNTSSQLARPITCITQSDAEDYVAWLNTRVIGQGAYRLVSRDEFGALEPCPLNSDCQLGSWIGPISPAAGGAVLFKLNADVDEWVTDCETNDANCSSLVLMQTRSPGSDAAASAEAPILAYSGFRVARTFENARGNIAGQIGR